ncbi:hypothetical protein FALBO_15272 [Fusarium albosuccineum]|uniref:Apple domain-containing protein n=1 Tax=Fusarium albosuccineum TaxID=1237068 RepID=A0A8H4KTM1_9HYPO|nr:hypothetical protein FALBO_15272 [Fusarium albosuccineum]
MFTGSSMASQFDNSPEVVPPNPSDQLPQVYEPGHAHQTGFYQSHNNYISSNSDPPSSYTYNDSQSYTHPPTLPPKDEADAQNQSRSPSGGRKALICGCPLVVVVLIAALVVSGAAVIGLAAATGVAVKQSQDSDSELKALQASFSSLSDVATATASSSDAASTQEEQEELTNGCSNKKDTITGTVYTSKFFDKAKFTMYCNTNAPNDPIFSIFATNFNGCIEACTAWNSYNTTRQTCEGVSFVPFWARIGNAAGNNAPGDCYLKPGPQDKDGLEDAQDTHAALLKS